MEIIDMTQEEKQFLLIDLCARLPYSVMMKVSHLSPPIALDEFVLFTIKTGKEEGIPYLRPMSSMTEEEDRDFAMLQTNFYSDGWLYPIAAIAMVNWLYAHHFDFNGLIPMGLALEAPEGMYKTE